MKISRSGAASAKLARSDWFAGRAWLDEITAPTEPSRIHVLKVTFEPGARTAWHSHPNGQTLHILSGLGRVQKAGEPAVEVRPGDTILIAPGERHWHGAAPGQVMVHIALQQTAPDGAEASWFEQVSDEEYNAGPSS